MPGFFHVQWLPSEIPIWNRKRRGPKNRAVFRDNTENALRQRQAAREDRGEDMTS